MTRAAALWIGLLAAAAAFASGPLDAADPCLSVGERRVMLMRGVDRAYAVPDDALEVAQLGGRTLVLTGRRAARVELHVRCDGRDWVKMLTVRGAPEAEDAGPVALREALPEPPHEAPATATPAARPAEVLAARPLKVRRESAVPPGAIPLLSLDARPRRSPYRPVLNCDVLQAAPDAAGTAH